MYLVLKMYQSEELKNTFKVGLRISKIGVKFEKKKKIKNL
ncbi:MAG: hypothetical protein ACI86M_003073 [Saprospiraceae bacterium]|jgi:hypothetical protein